MFVHVLFKKLLNGGVIVSIKCSVAFSVLDINCTYKSMSMSILAGELAFNAKNEHDHVYSHIHVH